jgi:protein-tyrosine-phosphatase
VTSERAGLHALKGTPASPRACAIAKAFGVSFSSHRARPITAELIAHADFIFVMDFQNLVELRTRFISAEHKTRLLATYSKRPTCRSEIPDPYYRDRNATQESFFVVAESVRNLVHELKASLANALH